MAIFQTNHQINSCFFIFPIPLKLIIYYCKLENDPSTTSHKSLSCHMKFPSIMIITIKPTSKFQLLEKNQKKLLWMWGMMVMNQTPFKFFTQSFDNILKLIYSITFKRLSCTHELASNNKIKIKKIKIKNKMMNNRRC